MLQFHTKAELCTDQVSDGINDHLNHLSFQVGSSKPKTVPKKMVQFINHPHLLLPFKNSKEH